MRMLAKPHSCTSSLHWSIKYRRPGRAPAARTNCKHSSNGATAQPSKAQAAAEKFGWPLEPPPVSILKANRLVRELPVQQIRRPLSKTRTNNEEKVQALMESISEIGLQEPIDVLEVEGQYYGFSGCHRYEAHQRLGKPTIKCRIRKANRQALRMHMM